jgi:methionyl-tRNA synthetase
VLCDKYYQGIVPVSKGTLSDEKLQAAQALCFKQVKESIDNLELNLSAIKLRDAQAEFINIARAGNKYLADTEPWKLIKTDAESVQVILVDALQICAKLCVAAQPFLPHTAQKLAAMLNLESLSWNLLQENEIITANHALGKAEILYKQVEDEDINKQLQRLEDIKKANLVQPVVSVVSELKPPISYEDFDKLDLRVGKVIAAVKVPKADKLLNLTVDLGFEQRTILSGIAEYYQPEELLGKLVTVVANLAPRKIRGIESQGMLLMAGNDFNKLYTVAPEQDIELGSIVK